MMGLSWLSSCSGIYYVRGIVTDNRLQISKGAFVKENNTKNPFRKYVLVKPEGFEFPLVVTRVDDSTYSAYLLKCTHQGNELRVSGDIFTCFAHGSEFNNRGEVLRGPAEHHLKSFPVTVEENIISIMLA